MTTEVTEPGTYDLPPEVYHGDPVPGGSLSSGGAKLLLPPSCPAKFRYWADNQRPTKPEFDFGHAAHKLILGAGPDIEVVTGSGKDPNSWRTDDDREAVQAAHDAGRIPVKPKVMEQAEAMAAAVRAHPVAGPLFEPGTGHAEQSLFWVDAEFGVWRRARPDWLPAWRTPEGLLLVPDYKTCRDADPASLERALVDLGYDQQADWYSAAAVALGLARAEELEFLFVFQEKDPPHVITVMRAGAGALERGRARNRKAMHLYRRCSERGVWPGYVEGVGLLSLPRWTQREFDDDMEAGFYDVKPSTDTSA